jgi:hypothetical protein
VVPEATKPRRDPRFDSLSGSYNPDLWNKSYDFLSAKQEEEASEIRSEVKKTKDPERREELLRVMQSLRGRVDGRKQAEVKQKAKSERTKAERELVAKGKKPFYLKESDAKGAQCPALTSHTYNSCIHHTRSHSHAIAHLHTTCSPRTLLQTMYSSHNRIRHTYIHARFTLRITTRTALHSTHNDSHPHTTTQPHNHSQPHLRLMAHCNPRSRCSAKV